MNPALKRELDKDWDKNPYAEYECVCLVASMGSFYVATFLCISNLTEKDVWTHLEAAKANTLEGSIGKPVRSPLLRTA